MKKKKEKIGQIICSWYEVLFFEKAGAGACPTGAVGLAVGGGQGVDVDSRRELGERWEHTFLSVTFPFLRWCLGLDKLSHDCLFLTWKLAVFSSSNRVSCCARDTFAEAAPCDVASLRGWGCTYCVSTSVTTFPLPGDDLAPTALRRRLIKPPVRWKALIH